MKHVAAGFLCMFASATMAAEIRVLSAGAVEPGLRAAAGAYTKQSGNEVKITFNTAPEIRKRMQAGEKFDVVIAPPAAIDELAAAGKLAADRAALGRVGLGVAVRPGAELPDISSTERLRASVLAADSIVFNRASTGIYLENLFKKMGIYEAILPKTTRYPDAGAVMEHVLKGKGNRVRARDRDSAPSRKGAEAGRAAARRHSELHVLLRSAHDGRDQRRVRAGFRSLPRRPRGEGAPRRGGRRLSLAGACGSPRCSLRAPCLAPPPPPTSGC
jgi:hypothetical protein